MLQLLTGLEVGRVFRSLRGVLGQATPLLDDVPAASKPTRVLSIWMPSEKPACSSGSGHWHATRLTTRGQRCRRT